MIARPVLACTLAVLAFNHTHPVNAEPIPVRFPQGSMHGFLALRTLDGKLIATGDATQTVRGPRIISRLTFHFRDGSLDDDQAVYTQQGVFRLENDHHVQRGPSFPKPTDISVDVPGGTVISHEAGKDGQEKVTTKHMELPPDLANGIWLVLIENMRASTPETRMSYVAAFGGARLIKIVIKPVDIASFRVGGNARPAQHFLARVELGGVTGVIAPLIGRQPHDLDFWLMEGRQAPGFVREEGQFYDGGPVWRIEQVSPVMH